MCRFVIGILVLSTAAAAPAQTPAVTKMLNLFQALQTSQYHNSQRVGFSFTESELDEYPYLFVADRSQTRNSIRRREGVRL
jgi:hypothetical protein